MNNAPTPNKSDNSLDLRKIAFRFGVRPDIEPAFLAALEKHKLEWLESILPSKWEPRNPDNNRALGYNDCLNDIRTNAKK